MTTELPSGETFTASKLTELKNSSSVSLGFAVWAWAKITIKTSGNQESSEIQQD